MAHNTFQGISSLTYQTRRPSTSSGGSIRNLPSYTSRSHSDLHTDVYSITPTCETTSTVWGPGALTGKFLKWVGEGGLWTAELIAIRAKLGKIEKMQSDLLGSSKTLTDDDRSMIAKQCRRLVQLCILGLHYPSGLVTRGFMIILNGFKLPGRDTWTYYIAEAISSRKFWEVVQIFQEGFFAVLDDSVFRLYDFVRLESLCFRLPVVAHEIATIISYLARKDLDQLSLGPIPSNSSTAEPINGGDRNLSKAIIYAGFFRLVTHWSQHGMPHWDQRGIKRLEDSLKDIAEAQDHHGEPYYASDSRELIPKLRVRRMDDVEEEVT